MLKLLDELRALNIVSPFGWLLTFIFVTCVVDYIIYSSFSSLLKKLYYSVNKVEPGFYGAYQNLEFWTNNACGTSYCDANSNYSVHEIPHPWTSVTSMKCPGPYNGFYCIYIKMRYLYFAEAMLHLIISLQADLVFTPRSLQILSQSRSCPSWNRHSSGIIDCISHMNKFIKHGYLK